MKLERAYKVARCIKAHSGLLRYFSAFTKLDSIYCVEYKLGVVVTPPIGGLYVFKSLFYAEQYRRYNCSGSDLIVMECEAAGLQYQTAVTGSDDEAIFHFWKRTGWCHRWPAPTGTYTAVTLKPLRVWHPESEPLGEAA